MKTVKFYLDCLSAAAYIVSSKGEAVVIDPQRDIDIYVSYLDENNLKLKYVLETHLHADFVSGHLELSNATNSQIVFGEKANAEFDHLAVKENDVLTFGNVEIKILETPGHTPEGVCFLMDDVSLHGEELSVFTGDTLFAGDVGRPDLMDDTLSKEILAKMLYESLHKKLLVLPDNTLVYPAHGAGSSCGRSLNDVEYSTIGLEKNTNYALQPMSVEEFTMQVTADQPLPPKYFALSAQLNRSGLQNVDNILNQLQAFSITEVENLIDSNDVTLIDVRDPDFYAEKYIPGSINIGLDGRYAEWLGSITSPDHRIVIIAEPGSEIEATIRAARVGFDKVIGYLDGGIKSWIDANLEIATFRRIDPEEINQYMSKEEEIILLDVRRPTEFNVSHLPHAVNIPLSLLEPNLDKLDNNKKYVVHCAGGYRSVIASSILKRNGFEDVIDIRGGYNEIIEKSIEIPHIH